MKSLGLFVVGYCLAATSYGQIIVNAGAHEPARPLAPNSLAVALGEFAGATPATANSAALPTLLGDVEVLVDGTLAGIYSVSKTQIDFVMPREVAATRYAKRVRVDIRINGTTIHPPSSVLVQDVSPAILVRDAADTLRPARAVHEDGSQNSQARPARAGEAITLYLTGDGHASDQETGKLPAVYFRTWAGETVHSGPADGQPGVWLVKVKVPRMSDSLSSRTIPVTVLFDGVHSNTATIWVQ